MGVMGLVAPSGQSVGVGRAESAARGDPVFVQNGLLRVGLDRRDGNLSVLTALVGGHNLLDDEADRGGLWELEVLLDGRPVVLTPGQAKSFRFEILSPEPGLRLIWNGFTLEGTASCTVEATLRLDAESPTSRWDISVQKPDALGLRQIRFPRVFALARHKSERLAVPLWLGQQASDPRGLLYAADGRGRRLAWDYPGGMSMQCVAFYENGREGLYAACNDTAAQRKSFAFWGTTDQKAHFETVHYPQDQALGNNRYDLPYQVLLGTLEGDWITAAERYRTWATRQPWARQSRLRRGLVPDWVLETGAWIWNRGRSPGVLPPAAAFQDRLGLPVSVFWHWWHGCPYDIGFPEYLPPREGTEAFTEAVARAHQDGLRMLVYMNQRAWGMSTRSWQEEGAQRFAVKGADGKVRPEVYNVFTGQALASMCLATSFWRDKYAGLAERAFKDLGVDGIYMDQACSQLPCYDPHHGHPLGGGNSWTEGFRELSGDIRNRCGEERRIVLSGEGCGEAWLPYLDLMLALQVSKERYSSPTDPWEVIPFFQAVYHPYAVTYGNYSSLTMPPYDELWPDQFAPEKPLVLLDRKYSRQFYLEQARAFVWGQQPTLANFLPAHLDERSEEIDYVMRLARVRNLGRKYLLYGEFLHPPELDAPEITSDFSRLSIYAGQRSRLTSCEKRHPLVLAGAWRAADGDVAVVLASVADRAIPLAFTIDPLRYGLPRRGQTYRIDQSGRRPIEDFGEDGPSLKFELPAREAWMIEFSKN
jgi:hypothetical protein